MTQIVWNLLDAETIAKLYAFQYETYGTKMEAPEGVFQPVTVAGTIEDTDGIERVMQMPPTRSRNY